MEGAARACSRDGLDVSIQIMSQKGAYAHALAMHACMMQQTMAQLHAL